ncbi:MAG: (d)CMP kinase [Actinomycetota bacterium]|nr:(d)CMP kinase [Actinomycetota bacterium]
MEGLLVTIDGPAGSGKSSVARAVAERLGLVNLNTGAAYRAVALLALHEEADPADADTLSTLAVRVGLGVEEARVDGQPVPEEKLRTPEVTAVASQVSAHPAVREVLLNVQRSAADEARKSGGAVVEGRDIGTVVLPDAEVKVFLLAAPEERARRRAVQSGREGELDRIQAAMLLRDQRDAEREASPLKAASDAVVIDTTGLSLEDVVSQVVGLAERNKNHE